MESLLSTISPDKLSEMRKAAYQELTDGQGIKHTCKDEVLMTDKALKGRLDTLIASRIMAIRKEMADRLIDREVIIIREPVKPVRLKPRWFS